MATTKNLCAQIPIDLHERVSEERERLGQTTSEYIANLIQDYYNMMENQKGGIQMTEKGRTMAFQIPEELFQRIKRHLERETLRTGKKLTQRDFVLNLITQALDEADAEPPKPQPMTAILRKLTLFISCFPSSAAHGGSIHSKTSPAGRSCRAKSLNFCQARIHYQKSRHLSSACATTLLLFHRMPHSL